MKAGIWEDLYQSLQKPKMDPVMTGFNANIDRIIQMNSGMLESFEKHAVKGIEAVLPRLKESMRHCSADEIFISNPALYRELSGAFSCYGILSVGGQAGIAAVHLRRLGVPSVTCVVPSAGSKICAFLKNADVIPLTFKSPGGDNSDNIHLVFEYPPGLVPLADRVISRSNRFIVSPLHDPTTVIIPSDSVDSMQIQITACRRAFLSGYQYLRTQQEFVTAASQIRMIRTVHPLMRTHVECVSGADRNVMALILRHIFPVADSIGLNERELELFMQVLQAPSGRSAHTHTCSPVARVSDAITLADATGVSRIHLHTFGYYILIRKSENSEPEVSRNALLLAAREVADAVGPGEQVLSREGLLAYASVQESSGPEDSTGIFRINGHEVVIVPTYISQNILKTAGLGDILSSTAFVADRF